MRLTRARILTVATAAIVTVLAVGARAQGTKATIHDPKGPLPDPGHISFVVPADIKWTGEAGHQQQAVLFGDPNKPGLYGILIKWYPGNFSRPHVHNQDRYAYVISGTWWVSSSTVYDEKKTYPLPAGSMVVDKANTVHWDGAREGETGPAVLELVGMGPVKTTEVDEQGKPK